MSPFTNENVFIVITNIITIMYLILIEVKRYNSGKHTFVFFTGFRSLMNILVNPTIILSLGQTIRSVECCLLFVRLGV